PGTSPTTGWKAGPTRATRSARPRWSLATIDDSRKPGGQAGLPVPGRAGNQGHRISPQERDVKLWSIEGNTQRLDGGSMFGNAPGAMWSQGMQPDARNRIPLATRGLLATPLNGRTVLFEAGIGAFFEPKLRERYAIGGDGHVLLDSLREAGFGHEDIDVVVLSHLHFDHAGGLLSAWEEGRAPQLLFPNATYVIGREQWERAHDPHPRDRASYIPELLPLLEASGRVELVDGDRTPALGDA